MEIEEQGETDFTLVVKGIARVEQLRKLIYTNSSGGQAPLGLINAPRMTSTGLQTLNAPLPKWSIQMTDEDVRMLVRGMTQLRDLALARRDPPHSALRPLLSPLAPSIVTAAWPHIETISLQIDAFEDRIPSHVSPATSEPQKTFSCRLSH
ncbi:hypothetical protein FRB96_000542 [Tulasnella sp. 330]|nr:hypothetical protein FRB96_000542 [Tulasnella sp. 330]